MEDSSSGNPGTGNSEHEGVMGNIVETDKVIRNMGVKDGIMDSNKEGTVGAINKTPNIVELFLKQEHSNNYTMNGVLGNSVNLESKDINHNFVIKQEVPESFDHFEKLLENLPANESSFGNAPHVKKFRCYICDKTLASAHSLRRHMTIHSDERPYKCKVCDKAFARTEYLATHHATHTKEKLYKCMLCGKSYTQSGTLAAHMKIHDSNNPYKCTVCDKNFTRPSDIVRHMPIHLNKKHYECHICKEPFLRSSGLKFHLVMHDPVEPLTCTICKQIFLDGDQFREHLWRHVQRKLHKCSICKISFKLKESLEKHHLVHTGESDMPAHNCPICNKACAYLSDLTRHMRAHTKEKPYPCHLCDKSFTRAHARSVHIQNLHCEEKPDSQHKDRMSELSSAQRSIALFKAQQLNNKLTNVATSELKLMNRGHALPNLNYNVALPQSHQMDNGTEVTELSDYHRNILLKSQQLDNESTNIATPQFKQTNHEHIVYDARYNDTNHEPHQIDNGIELSNFHHSIGLLSSQQLDNESNVATSEHQQIDCRHELPNESHNMDYGVDLSRQNRTDTHQMHCGHKIPNITMSDARKPNIEVTNVTTSEPKQANDAHMLPDVHYNDTISQQMDHENVLSSLQRSIELLKSLENDSSNVAMSKHKQIDHGHELSDVNYNNTHPQPHEMDCGVDLSNHNTPEHHEIHCGHGAPHITTPNAQQLDSGYAIPNGTNTSFPQPKQHPPGDNCNSSLQPPIPTRILK